MPPPAGYPPPPGYPPPGYPVPAPLPRHTGRTVLITSGILILVAIGLIVSAVILNDNAVKNHPEEVNPGEGYGFIALFGMLPCLVGVILFIVGLVELRNESRRRQQNAAWRGRQHR
jgi:hypothetical protein